MAAVMIPALIRPAGVVRSVALSRLRFNDSPGEVQIRTSSPECLSIWSHRGPRDRGLDEGLRNEQGRSSACDRRWRAGRSAGDALGGADCVGHAWLVRARADHLGRSRTLMVDATELSTRAATLADAAAIAAIYNEGIADRIATFETEPRSAGEIAEWFTGRRLVIVAESEEGPVVAFAASFPYSARACYAGIGEFSVYVSRDYRGRG